MEGHVSDARRKRINRYKKMILTIILLSVLIPWLICVILSVKLYTLENRVDDLIKQQQMMQNMIEAGQYPKEESRQQEKTVPEESGYKTDEDFNVPTAKNVKADEDAGQKKVYLTFDDGPSSNTAAILDILAEYGVKATFFVVGKRDEQSLALYKRIIDEGHTLGMHSYSHVYQAIYESREAFLMDLQQLQELLTEVTGVTPRYYRFPGGSSNKVSSMDMQEFIRCLHEQGIEYYDWNIENGDATNRILTVEELIENVTRNVMVYETSVVLMHDTNNKPRTVEALPQMIEQILAMGCHIVPIDDTVKPVQHIKAEEYNE